MPHAPACHVPRSALRSTARAAVATLVLLVAGTAIGGKPKVDLELVLFPNSVIVGTERDFTMCFVNIGETTTLLNEPGDKKKQDHLLLTVPLGAGDDELAEEANLAAFACEDPPPGWTCSHAFDEEVPATAMIVKFQPAGLSVEYDAGQTLCFDLNNVGVNAAEGLLFAEVANEIDKQRTEKLANGLLPLFKSTDGTIRHDDLDEVTAHQHHPQTWDVINTDDIVNLNDGNVGVHIFAPGAKLDVNGEVGADPFRLRIGGDIKLRMDPSGSLALGKFSPDARLSVEGDASFSFGGAGRLLATTPGGSAGIIGYAPGGHRREIRFDDSGMRLLASPDDGPSPLVNGIRINELGEINFSAKMLFDPDSGTGGGALLSLSNSAGDERIAIDADVDDAGVIRVKNESGTTTVTIDGDHAGGAGRVTTSVLEITGGADLSEQFDIAGLPEPGTVVSIDTQHEGRLIVSQSAYDRTVAGIVSGANDVRPGVVMGQRGSAADGAYPVALTGRVYCRVDETHLIRPGDLITSAHAPGRCMKVTDHARAQGAVLGKAMGHPRDGLVLVLVNLQ